MFTVFPQKVEQSGALARRAYPLQAAQQGIAPELTRTDEMGDVLYGEDGYNGKGKNINLLEVDSAVAFSALQKHMRLCRKYGNPGIILSQGFLGCGKIVFND